MFQFISIIASMLTPCLAMGLMWLELIVAIRSISFLFYSVSFDLHIIPHEGIQFTHRRTEHRIVVKPLSLSLWSWLGTLSRVYFIALSMKVIVFKKLLFIYTENMHMLRTSLSSQNLRWEHYNLLTFSNFNKSTIILILLSILKK